MKFKNKIKNFLNNLLKIKSSNNDFLWLYKSISRKNKLRIFKLIFLMIICSISEVLSVSAFSPFLSLLVDSKASVNFFYLIIMQIF